MHYLPNSIHRLVRHRGRFGFIDAERSDVLYSDQDSDGNFKGVYSIKLRDGTRIALDLAGAQYNIPHQSVSLLSTYFNDWGHAVRYRVPFRSHMEKHTEKMNKYRCITSHTIIMEQLCYFNLFLHRMQDTPDLHFTHLLTLDDAAFHSAMTTLTAQCTQNFLARSTDLDKGTTYITSDPTFDTRHPKFLATLRQPMFPADKKEPAETLLLDVGDMQAFPWDKLRKLIQMTGPEAKYKDKKKAKMLLGNRCVYKMEGDWRMVFLQDTLPSSKVPEGNVSVNPYWKA